MLLSDSTLVSYYRHEDENHDEYEEGDEDDVSFKSDYAI